MFDIPQEMIQVSNGVDLDIFKPVWSGGRVSFITKVLTHIPEQTSILAKTISSSIPLMHSKNEYIYYFCISEGCVGFLFYKSLRDAMVRDGILSSIYDPRLSFIKREGDIALSVYINHFMKDSFDGAGVKGQGYSIYDTMLEITNLQIVCADKSSCREKYAEISAKYLSNFSFVRSRIYSDKECFAFIVERNGCAPFRLLIFQSESEYSKSPYYNLTVKDEEGQIIEFQDVKSGSVVVNTESLALKSLSEVSFYIGNGYYSAWICCGGQDTIELDSREMGDDFYCIFLVRQSVMPNKRKL